ncbi:hypothetical protein F5Y19DRAFT_34521 [Xylariaceae sp. FL1651]|nr:hypothetical protein F5Y19DRAFT_34521 [Xylariaceae sp. FL1651]
MATAASSYGEISQSDNEDDRSADPSPTESPSPAPSSSPMPFLPAVESTFTPLSMDSDFYAAHGGIDQAAVDTRQDPEQAIGTATATAAEKARFGVSNMVHSLSPTRATNLNEYHLVSTDSTSSPPSPGPGPYGAADLVPQPDRNRSHRPDTQVERNFASNVVGGSSRYATQGDAPQRPTRNSAEEPTHHQVAQQTVVVVKPKPIVRTASTKSVSLRHPTPDPNTRSTSHASNIAQLEATAEKLSMTSSIDDAIRDLHDEQKRADSRRSSILAASIASIPETDEPVTFPLTKQISLASSIRETNTAARYGGYSPAGYVMSPNSSMVSSATRLRSGSTGMSKPDTDLNGSLSRHGPGKSSIRSVRSVTKPALTNIAEIEPTALTAAAMDEADRLAEEPEEETLQIPQMHDVDLTPDANQYYRSEAHDYWDLAVVEAQREHNYVDERPLTSAGSDGTFEQAERAFANFDGAHCSPDVDFEDSINFQTIFASPTAESPLIPSLNPKPEVDKNEADYSRPTISRPLGPPTVRPKSYLDPETGETMLYYPARVPMMLNLPQKLSKKPKTEVRNNRRSQVLSAMPGANRQSAASWLPEFTPEPLLDPLGPMVNDSTSSMPTGSAESHLMTPVNVLDEHQSPVESHTPPIDSDNRKSRISMLDPDKRKSQLPNLANLPPQLRASAFFDLPSELPSIQLKDGSATSTLDDILNASAKAPVSAFTDHAFAGSLGAEVYGVEKKRKSHMKHTSTTELEPRTRGSIFHLRKPSALSRHSSSQEEKRDTDLVAENDDERQHLSSSVDGEPAPEEEEEDGNELAYSGPPTTLLAELQMRKQQQKLRTRPVASAFPNGMHSTLLEMDTVAELERRSRKGKRVNLAWEDPNANTEGDEDDEDTPLGLLLATKGQNNGLIGAMAEVNRPLGLMEKRDMEDNEPLSVRRNRLQGRETGPIQRMTLARGLNLNGSLGPPSPQLRVVTPEEDEVEGETLGDRMRRLKVRNDDNPLPQARPVSSAFSAEMLSQLGDAFKDEAADNNDADKDKGKGKAQPAAEEETLGQRRRRLQAEREAREREMARLQLSGGQTSASPQVTKRRSLADVLGSHGNRTVLSDPRADAERAKQEEAARYKRDQEQKFAALRQQMPTNLSSPNLVKPGGFMSGHFNDGTGGGLGQPRESMVTGGFASNSAIPNPAKNASMMGNAFRVGGAMSSYGPPMTNPYGNPYSVPMQPQQPGQMDRVERWRQGVYP